MFKALVQDMSEKGKAAQQLGLSETGFAIHGILSDSGLDWVAEPGGRGPVADLAEGLEGVVEPHVGIVDWARKDDVQREMRKAIKRKLKDAGFPAAKVDGLAAAVVDLMKARRGR